MYQAEISRSNPTAFLFVIDQSGSMEEPIEAGQTKSRYLADVVNKTLYQLIIRCTRADGVRDYFDVGVIAYSGDEAKSGFGGTLAGRVMHPLSSIEANPLRIEERMKRIPDGAGGLLDQPTKFPVWFDPINSGGTPMTAAMTETAKVLAEWCDAHSSSYPPTVIHVTDGATTDGDPSAVTDAMKEISTVDGTCLLFNLHIASGTGNAVVFPSSDAGLDENGRLLFRMSSKFPQHLVQAAKDKGYAQAGLESRFFGYKTGFEVIVDFFEIGTRASNIR